jgi:maleamate amidohydrolase
MSDAQSASDNYQGVWGQRIGFGRKAALLMIDFMQGYTTPGAPLYAPGVVTAVEQAAVLLALARDCGTLVVHTNIRYQAPHFADGGVWVRKAPVMKDMVEGNPLAAFCEAVVPRADEPVLTKQYASAFFGTSIASTLVSQGVDTVVLVGVSTSGCIRATGVDAIQHGFIPLVVRDAVADRTPETQDANQFDLQAKYAEVVAERTAVAYLEQER